MERLYRKIHDHFGDEAMYRDQICNWSWNWMSTAEDEWSPQHVINLIRNVWDRRYNVRDLTQDRNHVIDPLKQAMCVLYVIGYTLNKRINSNTFDYSREETFLDNIDYQMHTAMIAFMEKCLKRKHLALESIDQYVARIQYETGIPFNSLDNRDTIECSKKYFKKYSDARYAETDLNEWKIAHCPHGSGFQSSIFFDCCINLFQKAGLTDEVLDSKDLESQLLRLGYRNCSNFAQNLDGARRECNSWKPSCDIYFNGGYFYTNFVPKNDGIVPCPASISFFEENKKVREFNYNSNGNLCGGGSLHEYPISENSFYRLEYCAELDGGRVIGNNIYLLPKNRPWIISSEPEGSLKFQRKVQKDWLNDERIYPLYVFVPQNSDFKISDKYEIKISQLNISRQGYKFTSLSEISEYKDVKNEFNVWCDKYKDFAKHICSGFYSIPSEAKWEQSPNKWDSVPLTLTSKINAGRIRCSSALHYGNVPIYAIVPNGFSYEFTSQNGRYDGISFSYESIDGTIYNLYPQRITRNNLDQCDFSELETKDIIHCWFDDNRIDILSPIPGFYWKSTTNDFFVEEEKECVAFCQLFSAEIILIPSPSMPVNEKDGKVEFRLEISLLVGGKIRAGYRFKTYLERKKNIGTEQHLYAANLCVYKNYIDSLLSSIDDLNAYVEVKALFDSKETSLNILRSEPLRNSSNHKFFYFSILQAAIKNDLSEEDKKNDIWIQVPATDDGTEWDRRYRIRKVNDFHGDVNRLSGLRQILVSSNAGACERLANYLWISKGLDFNLLGKYFELNSKYKIPVCNLWLFQAIFHNDRICSDQRLTRFLIPETEKDALKYPFEPELMRSNYPFEKMRQGNASSDSKMDNVTPIFYDNESKEIAEPDALRYLTSIKRRDVTDDQYTKLHSKCVIYFRQLSQVMSKKNLISGITSAYNAGSMDRIVAAVRNELNNNSLNVGEEKIIEWIADFTSEAEKKSQTLEDRTACVILANVQRLILWNNSVYKGINSNRNLSAQLEGFCECPIKIIQNSIISNNILQDRAQKWGEDIATFVNLYMRKYQNNNCSLKINFEKINDRLLKLLPLDENVLRKHPLDNNEPYTQSYIANTLLAYPLPLFCTLPEK